MQNEWICIPLYSTYYIIGHTLVRWVCRRSRSTQENWYTVCNVAPGPHLLKPTTEYHTRLKGISGKAIGLVVVLWQVKVKWFHRIGCAIAREYNWAHRTVLRQSILDYFCWALISLNCFFYFVRYFTLFKNLLNECTEGQELEQKGTKASHVNKLNALRNATIQAMSNLLSANIDSGLMHSISLGYHPDLQTRAAFMEVNPEHHHAIGIFYYQMLLTILMVMVLSHFCLGLNKNLTARNWIWYIGRNCAGR